MGLHAQKVLMRLSPQWSRYHRVAAPPPSRRESGESATDTGAEGTRAGLPRRHFPCPSLLLLWHCRWDAAFFASAASDTSGTSGRPSPSSAVITCHPAVIVTAKGSLTTAAPPRNLYCRTATVEDYYYYYYSSDLNISLEPQQSSVELISGK